MSAPKCLDLARLFFGQSIPNATERLRSIGQELHLEGTRLQNMLDTFSRYVYVDLSLVDSMEIFVAYLLKCCCTVLNVDSVTEKILGLTLMGTTTLSEAFNIFPCAFFIHIDEMGQILSWKEFRGSSSIEALYAFWWLVMPIVSIGRSVLYLSGKIPELVNIGRQLYARLTSPCKCEWYFNHTSFVYLFIYLFVCLIACLFVLCCVVLCCVVLCCVVLLRLIDHLFSFIKA